MSTQKVEKEASNKGHVQARWRANSEDLGTTNEVHSDSEPLEVGMLQMVHSLIRSLVCSHRSLIRLLRTARFTHVLRSFVCSLAHSLTRS